jgi:hypothetical protein
MYFPACIRKFVLEIFFTLRASSSNRFWPEVWYSSERELTSLRNVPWADMQAASKVEQFMATKLPNMAAAVCSHGKPRMESKSVMRDYIYSGKHEQVQTDATLPG